jgi:phospholipid/cholesterol/gamma-HCH transport system ATP-binding protein
VRPPLRGAACLLLESNGVTSEHQTPGDRRSRSRTSADERRAVARAAGFEAAPRRHSSNHPDFEPVLVFEDVWKAFGKNIIYEGLNLTVTRGEVLTIVGGSGTGKSVLLKCLLGLLQPDQGRIFAFGQEVTGRSEAQMLPIRQRVGMLFQGAALFDSMSVAENVAWPLVSRGWTNRQRIADKVEQVLTLVDLNGMQRRMPADLSGGMRKRVGLARTIAMEPEVILYDEPTTGLDPSNIKMIDQLVVDMQEVLGVTSIVVTHDMESAFRISDRIAVLYNKGIEWAGYQDEIESAENPIVRDFVAGNVGTSVG